VIDDAGAAVYSAALGATIHQPRIHPSNCAARIGQSSSRRVNLDQKLLTDSSLPEQRFPNAAVRPVHK